MPEKKYPKLVRDRIPEIIAADGKKCTYEIIPEEEFLDRLNEKLLEEVQEYIRTGSLEELADMGEVMHAILACKNIPLEKFQQARQEKLEAKGGFDKRILLTGVE